MRDITDDERRRRLAARHRVAPWSRDETLGDVADAVVALHSSDPASVFLSAFARLRDPSVDAVERALYDERSVVRFHAMRRTLWVLTPRAAQYANAGFTRRIAAAERSRTAKLFGQDLTWVGDAVDRVVDAVESGGGPISTREVGGLVPDLAEPVVVNPGKRYEGKIAPHSRALLHAAFEGRVVRTRPAGTWIGSQYAWVASSSWLDTDWSMPDELTGAIEIVRRWLERFGPGTVDDIVWWTGATRTLVGKALDALDLESVQLDDGSQGLVLADDVETHHETGGSWAALLPGLDPTPMGWKRRDWYLDPDLATRVVDRNGNIGPTVWVDGRVVGGWAQRPDGTIAHDADLAALTATQRRTLGEETERLREVVGEARFRVRFPSPNQKALLA